jgi:hypothetical protein
LKPDLEVVGGDAVACGVEEVEGEGGVDAPAEEEGDIERSRLWFTSVERAQFGNDYITSIIHYLFLVSSAS